jgi:hypothetical protein
MLLNGESAFRRDRNTLSLIIVVIDEPAPDTPEHPLERDDLVSSRSRAFRAGRVGPGRL